MNFRPRFHFINSIDTALFALAAIFLGLALLEFFWPKQQNITVDEQVSLPTDNVVEQNPLASLDADEQYEPITLKPLFTLDRQPYAPPEKVEVAVAEPVATPEPEPEPEIKFTLQGIIRTPAAQIALLKAGNANNAQRVAIEDTVEGWEIVTIDSNMVTLEKDGQQQVLYLSPSPETAP